MKRAAENRRRSRFGLRPGPSRRQSVDVAERLLAGLDLRTVPVRGAVSCLGHAIRSILECVTERESPQRDGRGARHPAVRNAGTDTPQPCLPAQSILPTPTATGWRRRVWGPSCRRGPGARTANPMAWNGTWRGTSWHAASVGSSTDGVRPPATSNAAWAFCA